MAEVYTQPLLFALTRRCPRCKETKPLDAFHKCRHNPLGIKGWCRSCSSAFKKQRRAEGYQVPGRIKPPNWTPKPRPKHPRIYRARTPQEQLQQREYHHRRYLEDPTRVKAHAVAYHAAHPESGKQRGERRRALMMGATVNDLMHTQWLEILKYFDHRCAYCNAVLTRPTKDHLVALACGGNHTAANIVPACQTCNSRKGMRSLMVFLLTSD